MTVEESYLFDEPPSKRQATGHTEEPSFPTIKHSNFGNSSASSTTLPEIVDEGPDAEDE